jgi:hypothetical protein
MLHYANEVWPTDCIKSFSNVKLNEKGRNFLPVQILNDPLDINKAFMNTPLLDKGCLIA